MQLGQGLITVHERLTYCSFVRLGSSLSRSNSLSLFCYLQYLSLPLLQRTVSKSFVFSWDDVKCPCETSCEGR